MTSIKLTETAFTRLNRVARELVDLTEELARASRLATVTRDSHGPLMSRIRSLTWDVHSLAVNADIELDWAAVDTSTESDGDNDLTTRKHITRLYVQHSRLYWNDSTKTWTHGKVSATLHTLESYNNLRDRFPQWADDNSIQWGE